MRECVLCAVCCLREGAFKLFVQQCTSTRRVLPLSRHRALTASCTHERTHTSTRGTQHTTQRHPPRDADLAAEGVDRLGREAAPPQARQRQQPRVVPALRVGLRT